MTVPAAGVDGRSTVTLPERLTGPELAIEITTVEPRTTTDRRYGDPVALPAAISELSAGTRTVLPADLDTGCRDDLLAIDGTPVPVQVVAPVADLLAGSPVEAVLCEPELALEDGPHELDTTAGTGLQVDRVVLAGPQATAAPAGGPTIEVTSVDRTSRTATVDGCREGCWLVLGEGFNDAWRAEAAGQDLGPPQLVDGGFNGWRLPPTERPVEVTMHWTAQRPQTIALLLTGADAARVPRARRCSTGSRRSLLSQHRPSSGGAAIASGSAGGGWLRPCGSSPRRCSSGSAGRSSRPSPGAC